tara:strand:+ start:37827 stop:39974 length:2148 start_codon:yes stop_codon:yes gene_type:complete
MKKQIIAFGMLFVLSLSSLVRADEGMWLPFMLGRNYEDMKKHGLNLTQEEIYSINNASIKDAIVSFGGFCTAEVISQKGLLLTNHHCGYDAIAGASTEENNYLENGFWAKDHSQEIPVEGLTATFVIRIEDVSEQINKNLTDEMSEEERSAKIRELYAQITKEAVDGTNYQAYVRDFFEGNEFYLFVTETYKDVRLVGTPPESIGKFGHDTDNWMYPRHTGDFSMFRIYAGTDNKPADFNESNKPYNPKYSLPISIKGYEEGDFSMVFGFPGSTDRYLSSWGVEQAVNIEQPKRVDLRAKKLEIMKKYMDESTSVRLNYASKYAQVANYWKYFIGQSKQVKNNKVADKKRAIEDRFRKFVKMNPEYEGVLDDIEKAYKIKEKNVVINAYQSEMIYSVDLNLLVLRYTFLEPVMNFQGKDRALGMYDQLKTSQKEFFNSANLDIEFEILEELLKMYHKDIKTERQPELLKEYADKGKIDKLVKKIRKKSIFGSRKNFEKFLKKNDVEGEIPTEALKEDMYYKLIVQLRDAHSAAMNEARSAESMLKRANRLFVKGYREMDQDKIFYPNANSTLRLTYGNILPYSPEEGKTYDIYTTLEEGLKKEDPNNPEFHVSPRLKELFENKDFGNYANEQGEMPVNFISNNDITGGNSGSPVINGDGQLIGTAFDGNWEAMSGDIFFEHDIQRTISCDIRYVLFIVEKYGKAENLIDEMEIVE